MIHAEALTKLVTVLDGAWHKPGIGTNATRSGLPGRKRDVEPVTGQDGLSLG